ncbi:hypothetical protein AMATHDRAFT_3139 [Amanita thiersii Skay4041]|uniref:Uncharacterized protein n=1 Tax=Amanita thiersii Skay4041 TaxID=703135 RepID=A0A2A9NU36_9AGAR|nr:hypothetical protein AMATHDRAFT_3139 [Amanita thiersii Skay4041]
MSDFLANGRDPDERASLISVKTLRPSPDTLTMLIKRLRALTLQLLPVEVEPDSLSNPTSRIITPQVISAYQKAAGDFEEALPYALLRARAQFMRDANNNPADYGENLGRAIACEVLARRIIHVSPRERLASIMSTRFQYTRSDSETSDMSSALEIAIDQQCEAQDVVNALWNGDIIQRNNANHDIDYVPYVEVRDSGFWKHFDASRLAVPRYQNIFRIVVWLIFLAVYSQAVREPLERLNPSHKYLDVWEIILYILALSFLVEDLHKFLTLIRFASWRVLGFWNAISLVTSALLLSAFALRVAGINATDDKAASLKYRSFQLVTIFDGYKYIGTMQICVARMLKESGIFFALLSVLAIGFYQGLYALDAADGTTDNPSEVVNVLIQALLQSPEYGKFEESPTGLILYYLWNTVTAIILLNVLISLFSSAYSEIIEDAEAHYLSFFAAKTIGMIRAPDSFVYPAPFNLIEAVFIAPFEFFPNFRLSPEAYAKFNRYVMTTIFFIPLSIIALSESARGTQKASWVENWLKGDVGDEDSPEVRDPEIDDPNCEGKKITQVPFDELVQMLPNTQQSGEATIIQEIENIKQQLAVLLQKLDDLKE